jgi:hypothetical protein
MSVAKIVLRHVSVRAPKRERASQANTSKIARLRKNSSIRFEGYVATSVAAA